MGSHVVEFKKKKKNHFLIQKKEAQSVLIFGVDQLVNFSGFLLLLQYSVTSIQLYPQLKRTLTHIHYHHKIQILSWKEYIKS